MVSDFFVVVPSEISGYFARMPRTVHARHPIGQIVGDKFRRNEQTNSATRPLSKQPTLGCVVFEENSKREVPTPNCYGIDIVVNHNCQRHCGPPKTL